MWLPATRPFQRLPLLKTYLFGGTVTAAALLGFATDSWALTFQYCTVLYNAQYCALCSSAHSMPGLKSLRDGANATADRVQRTRMSDAALPNDGAVSARGVKDGDARAEELDCEYSMSRWLACACLLPFVLAPHTAAAVCFPRLCRIIRHNRPDRRLPMMTRRFIQSDCIQFSRTPPYGAAHCEQKQPKSLFITRATI